MSQTPLAAHVLERRVVESGHDTLTRLTEAEARRAAFRVARLHIERALFAVLASIAERVLLAQALSRCRVADLSQRALLVAIALIATRVVEETRLALFASQTVRVLTTHALSCLFK